MLKSRLDLGICGATVNDKLGDWILLPVPPHSIDDFFILNQRQEKLDEFHRIRRCDRVQNLGDKVPATIEEKKVTTNSQLSSVYFHT